MRHILLQYMYFLQTTEVVRVLFAFRIISKTLPVSANHAFETKDKDIQANILNITNIPVMQFFR